MVKRLITQNQQLRRGAPSRPNIEIRVVLEVLPGEDTSFACYSGGCLESNLWPAASKPSHIRSVLRRLGKSRARIDVFPVAVLREDRAFSP
jgi:hypothetical protein